MATLAETLFSLGRQTLEDPRRGIRAVLDLGVPIPARTAALVLVAVASAIFMHLGTLLLPPSTDPIASFLTGSPIRSAILQWVILLLSVVMIYRVGRARGGTGSFADAMLIVVWLQVIMLAVQAVQLVALVLVPPLAGIINILGLVLFFWLMTSFIAELHSFTSRSAVFIGIVLTAFAVAFAMVVLVALFLGPEALSDV